MLIVFQMYSICTFWQVHLVSFTFFFFFVWVFIQWPYIGHVGEEGQWGNREIGDACENLGKDS